MEITSVEAKGKDSSKRSELGSFILQPWQLKVPEVKALVSLSNAQEILPLREKYRAEMNCQLIHDSIHRRPGWSYSYLIRMDDTPVGFAEMAVGGPWKEKPTVIEFFVLPSHRTRVFDLFETVLRVSGARFIETQTNGTLLAHMLHLWSRDALSESVLFQDHQVTFLPSGGAVLQVQTSEEQTLAAIQARSGGPEWLLELEGKIAGKGGILFHYNRPYGDIYYEIEPAHRGKGLGSYFVQELKKACYELGARPGARCNVKNVASRSTLQKAGFVPCGHLLTGSITSPT